jgi:hypothetical protein
VASTRLDAERPPLCVLRGQGPAAAAADIVAAYELLETAPDKVQAVHEAIARRIGDPDGSVHRAGHALAAAIDADGLQHDRNAYHNRQHFCEVMLAACYVCQLQALPARSAQRVVLAALVHDLYHDGESSRSFRLERLSLDRAAPYLAAAGIAADVQQALSALVLATEPAEGVGFARATSAFHAAGSAVPPATPAGAPELAALTADAALAREALILCEADVLPSAGFTLRHGLRLQDRLGQEWGRVLGARHKLRFVDDVLSSGIVGAFFHPNVQRMRSRLVELLDGHVAG